jgi:uncharacterized protein YecE (DUF72 family)
MARVLAGTSGWSYASWRGPFFPTGLPAYAPAPWERTADFVYLRGHGPSGRYERHYSRATLAAWRKSIKEWQQSRCDVYVYFDNDQKSAAPMDALALLRLLAR